jgi:hypothetical protein
MSGPAPSGPLSTALQCFFAVARHHGVDLSIERLIHNYALSKSERTTPILLEIARERAPISCSKTVAPTSRDEG